VQTPRSIQHPIVIATLETLVLDVFWISIARKPPWEEVCTNHLAIANRRDHLIEYEHDIYAFGSIRLESETRSSSAT
jgi:hypothetical protein